MQCSFVGGACTEFLRCQVQVIRTMDVSSQIDKMLSELFFCFPRGT